MIGAFKTVIRVTFCGTVEWPLQLVPVNDALDTSWHEAIFRFKESKLLSLYDWVIYTFCDRAPSADSLVGMDSAFLSLGRSCPSAGRPARRTAISGEGSG